MKKTIAILFFTLYIFLLTACSKSGATDNLSVSNIEISPSKISVLANNTDYVTFSSKIYDSKGAVLVDFKPDYTASKLDETGNVLKSFEVKNKVFKTLEPGLYKIIGNFRGVSSEPIYITATIGGIDDNGVYLEQTEFSLTGVDPFTYNKLQTTHLYTTKATTSQVIYSNLISSDVKSVGVVVDGKTITPNGTQYVIDLIDDTTNVEITVTQLGATTLKKVYTFQVVKLSNSMDITQLNIYNSSANLLDINFDKDNTEYKLIWESSLFYQFDIFTLNSMKIEVSINGGNFYPLNYVQETSTLKKFTLILQNNEMEEKSSTVQIKSIAPSGAATIYNLSIYIQGSDSLINEATFNGSNTSSNRTISYDESSDKKYSVDGSIKIQNGVYDITLNPFSYDITSVPMQLTTRSSKSKVTYSLNGQDYNSYIKGSIINVPLELGDNYVYIIVTSEDSKSISNYKINVKRIDADTSFKAFEINTQLNENFSFESFNATHVAELTENYLQYTNIKFVMLPTSSNAKIYYASTLNGETPTWTLYSNGTVATLSLKASKTTDTGYLRFKIVNGTANKEYTITYKRWHSQKKLSDILKNDYYNTYYGVGTARYLEYVFTDKNIKDLSFDNLTSTYTGIIDMQTAYCIPVGTSWAKTEIIPRAIVSGITKIADGRTSVPLVSPYHNTRDYTFLALLNQYSATLTNRSFTVQWIENGKIFNLYLVAQ